MIKNSEKSKGFTLVEVIVTITVSSILFAIIASIIVSFSNSYKKTTRIRDQINEIETIENYVSLSIQMLNSKGNALYVFYDSNTGFTFINLDDENKEILKYNKTNKTISNSNSFLDLEYTSDISIKQSDNGLILIITTNDNTTYLSYYKVLNFGGSDGN